MEEECARVVNHQKLPFNSTCRVYTWHVLFVIYFSFDLQCFCLENWAAETLKYKKSQLFRCFRQKMLGNPLQFGTQHFTL